MSQKLKLNPVQWARALMTFSNRAEIFKALMAGADPARLCIGDLEFRGDIFTLHTVLNEIFVARQYQPVGLELGPQDTVLDIGANVGIFTIFASQMTSGRIVAVEPMPANCEQLRANLAANGIKGVTVFNAGVAAQPGEAKLFLSHESGGHTLYGKNINGPLSESVSIKLMTFEQVMEQSRLDRIDYLKVDCEGAEGEILPSIPDAWWPRIGKIAIEYHDNVSALNHERLAELLRSKKYKVWTSDSGNSPFGYLFGIRQ